MSIKRECGLSLKRCVLVFPSGIYTKYKQLLAKDKLIFRRLSKVSTKEFRLESPSVGFVEIYIEKECAKVHVNSKRENEQITIKLRVSHECSLLECLALNTQLYP